MRTLLARLWTLRTNGQAVCAELHCLQAAEGYERMFTWNGRVQETHLRRGQDGAAQVRALADEKRAELEGQGAGVGRCDSLRGAMTRTAAVAESGDEERRPVHWGHVARMATLPADHQARSWN